MTATISAATTSGSQLFISGDGILVVVTVYPYQTEAEETIVVGHAPGIMAITGTSPSYLLVPDPEAPPPLRFLSRSTPAIPKPIESRTNPDGSGASSVTGLLKVSAKLGSSSRLM